MFEHILIRKRSKRKISLFLFVSWAFPAACYSETDTNKGPKLNQNLSSGEPQQLRLHYPIKRLKFEYS